MLRILHVVTDMNRGGLETFLMNYYRKIDRDEIQFDFLVHREAKAEYDDEIESMGGIIYRFQRLNPFSVIYKKKLGVFFDNHPEYKIVHVHQDCLSSVILKVAQEHGVKVRIAHSHSSSQNKDIKYPIKLFFKRFISEYATSLIACSDEAGKWMFNGASYITLNNAIDAEKYVYNPQIRGKVRKKLGIDSDELVVGHVGRFSPPKNHNFIIEVFEVIRKRKRAKLLLVGEGYLQKQVEKKVKDMHLESAVIFTGLRTDVSDLLQAMDVFVFPSLYEGLPLSIIEAQAAGLPCLISEKVPIECKKTSAVQQIELSKGASEWADYAINAAKSIRKNTYNDICIAGYDVKENVKWLEEFYKMQVRGEL